MILQVKLPAIASRYRYMPFGMVDDYTARSKLNFIPVALSNYMSLSHSSSEPRTVSADVRVRDEPRGPEGRWGSRDETAHRALMTLIREGT